MAPFRDRIKRVEECAAALALPWLHVLPQWLVEDAAAMLRVYQGSWTMEGGVLRHPEGRYRHGRAIETSRVAIKIKPAEVITTSVEVLLQRTKTVPIIFTGVGDPVAAGLVSSLALPGGNATGLSADLTDLSDKYIEFCRELVPDLRRPAIMFNPENQASARGFRRTETMASKFGIEVFPAPGATLEQLEPALAVLARERPQILIVFPTPPFGHHSAQIAEFAIRHGIVPLGNLIHQVHEGCLLAYCPGIEESARRVAYYVDRVLRGAAPRDLLVDLMKIRLTINLATARALGITIPASILARADEVIE